jgi:hypothetical protein
MVTGAVPLEVSVTDCVAAVFRLSLPNARVVAPMLSVGTAAFNCRAKVLERLPALAVSVTAWAVVTEATVDVNPALVAPAATVTVAGRVTAALLLARLTLRPPVGAAPVKVTVQTSLPDPVNEAFVQETVLKVAAATPVPLRLIAAVPLVEEVLVTVNLPVAAPAVVGSNLTVNAEA